MSYYEDDIHRDERMERDEAFADAEDDRPTRAELEQEEREDW